MNRNVVKGKIRVIVPPDGEAPLRVREEWVGVTMSVVGVTDAVGKGVISRKDSDSEPAFMVRQSVAIEALRAKSQRAANWWNRNGFPEPGQSCFGFKVTEVVVVEEIELEPVRQFLGLLEVGVGAHDHPANQ